jgi:dUTP pyrophosphatase
MEELRVSVAREEGAELPRYATPASSGMDIYARLNDPVTLKSLERALIPTGLRIAVPEGYEAQVRPRSGLAHQQGITVLNTPGTIDADYRGEVKILLVNLSADPVTIRGGDRIAQIVFSPVIKASWLEEDELDHTQRGKGGFGSTGTR